MDAEQDEQLAGSHAQLAAAEVALMQARYGYMRYRVLKVGS